MKHAKRIGSLILVIALCFTLMNASAAHASGLLGGQAAGAWVAAGLVALNIVADVAIGSIGNYFGWQGHPTSTTLLQQDLQYTFPVASQYISDYMNAATIKVDQGVVTIDGVEYDELWVSPGTFTHGLKTNLFDFKTKWELLSGQAGNLATGAGYYYGNPVFKIGNNYQTQKYVFTGPPSFSAGDIQVSNGPTSSSTLFYVYYNYPEGTQVRPGSIRDTQSGKSWWSSSNKTNWTGHFQTDRAVSNSSPAAGWVEDEFQYDYVSGVVPAEESEIPEDYGLSLKIPHDKLQTFYNTYPQYNIDNSVINIQQDEIDIDELSQAIFDMIDSMEDMKAEWTSGEEPEPPIPVDPIENIDQNVQDITGYQEDMQQQVDHMHQDVEAIHQTQQQQQQVQQQMQQDTSSIDSTLKDVTATPGESDLPGFKFDLRELFPFCIPFDIYRLLSSFDATPQAPHVRLPIVIQSIGFNYTLDLDFSSWDPVAQAMRTAELIVYAIGLAWATGKVIKW